MGKSWSMLMLGAMIGCSGATTGGTASPQSPAEPATPHVESEFDEAYWAEAPEPMEPPAEVGVTRVDVVPCQELREPMPQPRVHVRAAEGGISIRHLVRGSCDARLTPALENDGTWLQLTTVVSVDGDGGETSCDSVARAAVAVPPGEYEVWIIEERATRTQRLYVGTAVVP